MHFYIDLKAIMTHFKDNHKNHHFKLIVRKGLVKITRTSGFTEENLKPMIFMDPNQQIRKIKTSSTSSGYYKSGRKIKLELKKIKP